MKEKVIKVVKILGLGFLEPLFRINEKPKEQAIKFFKMAVVPLLTFILFLMFWDWGAESIQDIVNERDAQVDYNNDKDNAIKQYKMSPKEAEAYAQAKMDTFWLNIKKNKYLDEIYGEIKPTIEEIADEKKAAVKKSGIKLKRGGVKREYSYETMNRIDNMSSLVRSTIKVDREQGIGENSKTVYLILTDKDVQKIPENVRSTKYDGVEIKLNQDDLYRVLVNDKFNYLYKPRYLPRPKDVWKKWQLLLHEHKVENEKEDAFHEAQQAAIAKIKKSNKSKEEKKKLIEDIKARKYPGYPTIIDQIFRSILTVLSALILAAFIAIPLGILMGLSPVFKAAINPIVQLFKPVSPVVWFMLVAMIVNALIETESATLPKEFTVSYIAVALCAMWATLINTSVGVASVDQDLLNVASVLQVKGIQKVFKVILPSAIPMIFTGLRITVTSAWMVLIAVELLSQNPGLGKFVWDEFNNGSSDSNAKIIAAMFVIGIVGFFLDRIMLIIQKQVSYEKKNIS